MRIIPCLLVLTAIAACGDGTGPSERRELRLISGHDQADTLRADLPEPLTVQVMADGEPAVGVEVVFQSLPDTTFGIGVHLESDGRYFTAVRDTTDGDGLARVALRFTGFRSHTTRVLASVPAWQLADTAVYIIEPVAPAWIEPTEYAAVHIGDSIRYPGVVKDGYNNPRADTIECTSTSDAVRVGPGCMLHGVRFGEAVLALQSGDLTAVDTVYAVPPGEIAVANYGIDLLSTDGTVRRRIWGRSSARDPEWTPAGDSIAFVDPEPALLALTGERRIVSTALAGGPVEFGPTFSEDGSWIYYGAEVGDVAGGVEIWRVRRNGTGAERIGPFSTAGRRDLSPDVSPDGTFVVYTSSASASADESRVQLLDLASGSVTDLGAGSRPRIAPDGSSIGLIRDRRITIISLEGAVLQQFDGTAGSLDWSPDGEYLVFTAARIGSTGQAEGGLVLLELATGRTIPLRGLMLGGLHGLPRPDDLSWRPAS